MALGGPNTNRQAMIDKIMCKPGYTWNETLGRCLGAGGGMPERPITPPPGEPDVPGPPMPQPPREPGVPLPPMPGPKPQKPGEAIAMEAQMRRSQGVA